MTQSTQPPLTSVQQTILDVVRKYPGRFSRSGLAKMLVGAKSWQDTSFPEYGRLARYARKDLTYQIDVLLQQQHLALDSRQHLVLQMTDADETQRLEDGN